MILSLALYAIFFAVYLDYSQAFNEVLLNITALAMPQEIKGDASDCD